MNTKTCKTCHRELPLTEFYTDKRNPDGYVGSCKQCEKEKRQRRKQVKLNQLQNIDNTYTKKCSNCLFVKNHNEFQINLRNADGLDTHCKECRNRLQRIQYRTHNPVRSYYNFYDRQSLSFHDEQSERIEQLNFVQQHRQVLLDTLGYTIQELRDHLQSQFQDNMSWANLGDWIIKHHHTYSYQQVGDTNFCKLWDLENLYPDWKDN